MPKLEKNIFACRHTMSVYFDGEYKYHMNSFQRGSLASCPRGDVSRVDDQALSSIFMMT